MSTTIGLAHGAYTAEVEEVGAALRSLRHGTRDLVFRIEADVPTPPFAGAALAPWPNRIADGRYRFGGETHQLPVNEVGRGNAIHGLALWDRWKQAHTTPDSVTLTHTLYPRPGYPFAVGLSTRYDLGEGGLRVSITARNLGAREAPVGLSTHPYLAVGDGRPLDEWSLQSPCTDVIQVDDRLLPRRTAPVAAAGLDFTRPTQIGSTRIDHAFVSARFDDSGRASAVLTGRTGSGVQVSWGTDCRWLQVYTLHAPGLAMHRRAVAIEPMTCAPDAFNSGEGLIALAPRAQTSMSCCISAIEE
jgi:aldose 1-epimerase